MNCIKNIKYKMYKKYESIKSWTIGIRVLINKLAYKWSHIIKRFNNHIKSYWKKVRVNINFLKNIIGNYFILLIDKCSSLNISMENWNDIYQFYTRGDTVPSWLLVNGNQAMWKFYNSSLLALINCHTSMGNTWLVLYRPWFKSRIPIVATSLLILTE